MEGKKCSICGYSLYVEKHHPEGKQKFMVYRKGLGLTADIIKIVSDEFDDILHERLLSEGYSNYIESNYIKPDNWLYLCPNCHKLHHKMGYTLEEIQNLYNYKFTKNGVIKINKYKNCINEKEIINELIKNKKGKICACGRIHYKTNVIINCMFKYEKLR